MLAGQCVVSVRKACEHPTPSDVRLPRLVLWTAARLQQQQHAHDRGRVVCYARSINSVRT